MSDATPAPQAETLPEALKRNAVWLIVLGCLLIAGGTIAILTPFIASLFVITVIGITFLATGIAQVVQAFQAQGWRGSMLHILVGVLYALGGLLIVFEPLAGLLALTIIVIATFLAGGVVRLLAAWQLYPERGWSWVALGGLASMVAGVVIWANYPVSAVVVLGVVAGVSFLIEGWGMLALGLAARRMA